MGAGREGYPQTTQKSTRVKELEAGDESCAGHQREDICARDRKRDALAQGH